jgi:hypothetical protein
LSSDCRIDDSPDCITGAFLGDTYRLTAWVKAGLVDGTSVRTAVRKVVVTR